MDGFVHPLPPLLRYGEDLHALVLYDRCASLHLFDGRPKEMSKES